ncbi:MAG: hypothetical protein D6788_09200 [Planctomycetota bacterium]|nr:MAG: hypothetical protein D6788_09200 [Planctomycetota bacterium]
MPGMDFSNTTSLSDRRLRALFEEGADGWATGRLVVRVRYSRGADFSGTCLYARRRIYINIGRHLRFPYRMTTYLAKAVRRGRTWYRPAYVMPLQDGCQLACFLFMHELYHLLVKRAGRNTRQKEAMCDRFAARFLADRFGVPVLDSGGRPVPRERWEFQDLDGFVEAARDKRTVRSRAARLPVAVSKGAEPGGQLPLFSSDGSWG